MRKLICIHTGLNSVTNISCTAQSKKKYSAPKIVDYKHVYPMQLPNDEWKKRLTAEQYILRKEGTGRAYTGKYQSDDQKGIYYSAASLQPVFSSDAKFDSGTGRPSFFAPIATDAVFLIKDTSYGMVRWSVVDSKTGSHLGHVFDDRANPTGKRYCINSVALIFVPKGGKAPTSSKQ